MVQCVHRFNTGRLSNFVVNLISLQLKHPTLFITIHDFPYVVNLHQNRHHHHPYRSCSNELIPALKPAGDLGWIIHEAGEAEASGPGSIGPFSAQNF